MDVLETNKQWLINEIEIMGSETSESYPHEQMVDREVVYDLIDQLDEPEKIVIPQFVADWWERDGDSVTMYGRESINKKSKLHLISEFHDRGLGDHLSKVEDWLDENDSIFLDLVNGKPYEVEKEKLYYVELIKDSRYVVQASDGSIWFSYTVQKERLHGDKVMFTQREIAAIDPRFWPFAVEVSE